MKTSMIYYCTLIESVGKDVEELELIYSWWEHSDTAF